MARLRLLPRILFITVSVAYPVLIFYFLVIHKTPLRLLSLFIIALAMLAFITATAKKKASR
jgi:hypothetical protein